MTYVINLETFVDMSGQGGYAGTFSLSNESVLLILTILDDAKRLEHWTGDNNPLTSEEIDTIFEIVDEAIAELVV